MAVFFRNIIFINNNTARSQTAHGSVNDFFSIDYALVSRHRQHRPFAVQLGSGIIQLLVKRQIRYADRHFTRFKAHIKVGGIDKIILQIQICVFHERLISRLGIQARGHSVRVIKISAILIKERRISANRVVITEIISVVRKRRQNIVNVLPGIRRFQTKILENIGSVEQRAPRLRLGEAIIIAFIQIRNECRIVVRLFPKLIKAFYFRSIIRRALKLIQIYKGAADRKLENVSWGNGNGKIRRCSGYVARHDQTLRGAGHHVDIDFNTVIGRKLLADKIAHDIHMLTSSGNIHFDLRHSIRIKPFPGSGIFIFAVVKRGKEPDCAYIKALPEITAHIGIIVSVRCKHHIVDGNRLLLDRYHRIAESRLRIGNII